MRAAIRARLGGFVERGELEGLPSPWQVRAGWVVMLPVTLSESDRERAQSRRTWLGQVPLRVPLQVLYNPSQLLADTGIGRRPDQLVRHLLSVFHEPAFLGYDLQLLGSHPDGLAMLQREARRVVEGRSGWSPLLKRMVGGSDYHERLIGLATDAREGRLPDPLDLDLRFATLLGFARYCRSLPDWPAAEFYGLDLGRLAHRP